jgi:hypothetical protein
MTAPHDFEFQLGRNSALKGRGWRGLMALGLLLIAAVAIIYSGSAVIPSLRAAMAVFAR